MPVVDVDPDELRTLVGTEEKTDDELIADLFALGLEFEGRNEAGKFQLEFAPDRLDRLSVEGVARSLRYQYGLERGVYVPSVGRSNWTIEVDPSVPTARPYVTGAVARDVSLTEDTLTSLIQLQEKLHETMGRSRAKGAIGLHDLTMLQGDDPLEDGGASVTYRGISGDGGQFVPLESSEAMTPARVLEAHPTGQAYAGVVADYESFPAIYDEIGLFSFPPIINGQRTEVTTGTRDLFIELTGTDEWTIEKMLTIVCYALDARGASIESVTVEYPDRTHRSPDLERDRKHVSHARIERTLGIELTPDDVIDLLERAGLDAVREEDTDTYAVEIPPYRVDVLHPVDLVDDVGRAYGFNDLKPRYPEVGTVGTRHNRSRFERVVRELLVGLGFEDLLNFHLISERANFDRIGVEPTDDAVGGGQPVTISEPYSEEYEIVRTWALPSLCLVLENNTHRAYPQRLCDIGLVASVDRDERLKVTEHRTVAGVIATHDTSFEDAAAPLAAICRRFGLSLTTQPTTHPSFIDGRAATIDVGTGPIGIVGELHPRVVTEFDVEVPVAAFEVRLDGLQSAVESHNE